MAAKKSHPRELDLSAVMLHAHALSQRDQIALRDHLLDGEVQWRAGMPLDDALAKAITSRRLACSGRMIKEAGGERIVENGELDLMSSPFTACETLASVSRRGYARRRCPRVDATIHPETALLESAVPFKEMKLACADVEWSLATHEGRGMTADFAVCRHVTCLSPCNRLPYSTSV